MELNLLRLHDAGQFECRRHHVLQVNRRVNFSVGGCARSGDNERHANGVIVKVLLAEEAMMADGEAVIGREENPGVVGQAAPVELIENAADLRVEMRDESIVFAAM